MAPDQTTPTFKEYLNMTLHRVCITTHGVYFLLQKNCLFNDTSYDIGVECLWLNNKGTIIKRKYYR